MIMQVKKSQELTLKDKLSRLNFTQACKLLGEEGKMLIQEGGKFPVVLHEQVYLGNDQFRLNVDGATVSINLMPDARRRLAVNCTLCGRKCPHMGAAFSIILEEKMALGLAAPPPQRIPVESLSEEALIGQALTEREERAKAEKMTVRSADREVLWTDYTITSALSGRTYRVSLRGWDRGESYCSCPDFRKNTLGTCKHIMHALEKVTRRFPASVRNRPYQREHFAIHLRYGPEIELRWLLPDKIDAEMKQIVRPVKNNPVIRNVHDLLQRIRKIEALGHEVLIYPDAEECIQYRLSLDRLQSVVGEIRDNVRSHPLRKELLKSELLPYQLDGIAFAVGAGRAVLADDMGLGKTIQGIGVAELLAREAGIQKVLIVCPASVKAQWRAEIKRFSDRDVQLVLGRAKDRPAQYQSDCFFTICNYEQVLKDILALERVKWDLIILDEGQRIKNWEAKTTRVMKGLESPFALVLSGTPMENRLDELYSVVEFVDMHRLGPAFQFFNRHRVVNKKGRVLGYKNLDELRKKLKPILLRRTRDSVLKQLPPRTTEIVRITPTAEQLDIHVEHMRVVGIIVRKPYITEMDLLRLQKALLMCRMVADSTYLVDKQHRGYSTKLEKLEELLSQLDGEENRKILLFSEWTTMLGLIEPILQRLNMKFVRLDGSVPQKKRPDLVHAFQQDPECKLFITTNAGATGLNLQAANTVINVDLPWNPAILEQRIGRAHRMGQKRPVQVFLLVSEGTIEENLLATLSAKRDLALAALDSESNVDELDMPSGMDELKRRLEILLGAHPEAALDESQKIQREEEARRLARKESISRAGGQLLSSTFQFLDAMIPKQEETEESKQMAETFKARLLECLEKDEQGEMRLTVTLPDASALDDLARSMARLLNARGT